MESSTTPTPPPSSTRRKTGSKRAACSAASTLSARQPQLVGPGEACKAPSQPVRGEAEVPLPKGDNQIDIICAGELLQHEGMGREKEEEAAGEVGPQQHRPNAGSDQRRWGAHPREGVQACSKHHERVNERAPGAARRDLLR